MNKKILAVALAILFIATAFTACKTKLDMTEINGTEFPLLTDKNGETIINEDNQVAVIVTDRDGEVITYENGRAFECGEPIGWTDTMIFDCKTHTDFYDAIDCFNIDLIKKEYTPITF